MRSACELIRSLPGGPPFAVQILDDINRKHGLAVNRYANLLRVARVSLDLPRDSRLVCGGIKGADFEYLYKLATAGALEQVDALSINVFPPQNGIENPSGLKMTPSNDVTAFIELIGAAAAYGKEVWVGELGVANSLTGYGVDSFTQAGLLPRAALILLSEGAQRVTMFTAYDPPMLQEELPEGTIVLNFGLIPYDLRPRPWGWAMRNLNILSGELVPSVYAPTMSWAPEFPGKGETIYHVWMENDEYLALIFWTANQSAIEMRTGIVVYDENIDPVMFQNLMTEKPQAADKNRALNLVVVGNMPLAFTPTVLIFKRLDVPSQATE
jgi:hypothetical protein